MTKCKDCNGTGKYIGFTKIETCSQCKGTGTIPDISTPLLYNSIVREEILPIGQLPKIKRCNRNCLLLPRKGAIPDSVIYHEEVIIPVFEISSISTEPKKNVNSSTLNIVINKLKLNADTFVLLEKQEIIKYMIQYFKNTFSIEPNELYIPIYQPMTNLPADTQTEIGICSFMSLGFCVLG